MDMLKRSCGLSLGQGGLGLGSSRRESHASIASFPSHASRWGRKRQTTIRVNATWQRQTGSGKKKVQTVPPTTLQSSVNNSKQDLNFELPELPNFDDIRADRVIRGSLVGTFVGTILSIAVSPVQYVLAAAAVASGVSLVPYFDSEELGGKLKDVADSKGAELPGQALGTAVSKGQEIAEGNKPDGSAATVLTAALVAGSTVSLFAAKSLPLVFGGSAIYVAAQADNNLNLTASTLQGRDFLRSKKEAGVGILFSLIALQAQRAADAVTALIESQDLVKSSEPALAESSAKVSSPSLQSKPTASPPQPVKQGKPGVLTKEQIDAMQDQAEKAQQSILAPVSSAIEALSSSLSAKTPQSQLQGGPDESQNPVTTAKTVVSPKPSPTLPKSPASPSSNGTKPSPTSFEPSLNNSILGNKSPNSSSQFQPSLQDSILQSSGSDSKKQPISSPTPLEKQKGGNRDVGAGDLATGPPEKKEVNPLLKPDSPATKTPDSSSPLEKLKGTPEKESSPLSTGKPDSVSKDSLLQKGSPATQSTSSGTPLKNVKGGNRDVKAGDLTTGKPEIVDKTKDAKLTANSPTTQKPSGTSTPLENVKGGNRDVKAGDLTTGKPEVVDKTDEALLTGKSPATQKPEGSKTPLENVKGGNKDIKAGDLTTGKPEVVDKTADSILTGKPAQKSGDAKTPLENVKGGNRDISAGDLTTGKPDVVSKQDQAILKPDSPATKLGSSSTQADVTKIGSGSPSTTAPGQSTPLENVKGGNRDMGMGDLASGPSNFKAAAQQPVLEGTSPTSSAQTASPLGSLKGTQKSFFDDDQQTFKHYGQDIGRNSNNLLLQSSTGLGKALSLRTSKPNSGLQTSSPTGKQDLLDSMARKAEEAGRGSQVPNLGKSVQDSGASSSVGSIVSKPYESGKTALEQALPPTQAQPQKRSAAGPSEISKLARNAPPALVRKPADIASLSGLQKSDPGNVPALSPRANVSVPQPTPQKKQNFVGQLLVLAGTGILGSLMGVLYYLVNGQTIAHQVPRTLLTVIFCCIAAIILLVSLGKKDNQGTAALGSA